MSIVGQYQAIGPIASTVDAPLTPKSPLPVEGPGKPAWRRLDANAEGAADLSIIANQGAAYLYTPVLAPENLDAKLVLDTTADLKVWLDGKELTLPASRGRPAPNSLRPPDPGRPRAGHPGCRRGENRPGDHLCRHPSPWSSGPPRARRSRGVEGYWR